MCTEIAILTTGEQTSEHLSGKNEQHLSCRIAAGTRVWHRIDEESGYCHQ